jgi:hypothetical protein
MGKPQDRMISQRPDGSWANKRNDADKASSLHAPQREAINAARENLKHQGGGELVVQNRHGRIDRKDTIAPGHDPFPPRG